MKQLMTLVAVFLAFGFSASDSLAQGRCGGPGAGYGRGPKDGTGPRHEKFMEMRGKVLREKVGLSEETATQVEAILDEYRAKRFEVAERINDLTEKLATLEKDPATDDATLLSVMGQLKDAHYEMHDLKSQEWEAIGAVTTPREQARMMVTMHELHSRMGPGGKGFKGKGRGMGRGPGPDFD